MLSSISPLGERARHNRWAVTVTWYVVASTATALFIGAALGGLGRLLGLPLPARAGILAALAVASAVGDAAHWPLPGPRRQVDEDWLGRYRGWVYGAGFGGQLGAGVTTIVTTATIWLCLASELLSGSAAAGAAIGAAFGLLRAAPVLAAGGTRSYAQLQSRHRTIADLAPAARRLAVAGAGLAAVGLGMIAGIGGS